MHLYGGETSPYPDMESAIEWAGKMFSVRELQASSTVIAFSIMAGVLIMLLLSGSLRSSGLSKLPGPSGYPLIGCHFKLYGPHRHAALAAWASRYGGIFKVPGLWGSSPVVVIADPALAKVVLNDLNLPKFLKHYNTFNEMLHREKLPSMYSTKTSGLYWRAVRKCVVHAFCISELKEDFEVAKLKALLLSETLLDKGAGVAVDMGDAALRLSLDVMGLSKFGYDFHATEGKGPVLMLKLMKECNEEWSARRMNPLRRWFWWGVDAWADGRKKYQILQAFSQEMLSDVKKRGTPPDEDKTLAAQLVRLRDPVSAAMMDPQHLLSELATFIFAGHETTAHAISWALLCLAAVPEQQSRLANELHEAGVTTKPQRVGYDKVMKLPFLDAVVREALRLYPSGGEGSVRQVVSKTGAQVGSHHLPKGTVIMVHTYSMHRSPRLWLEPGRFKPDRWLSDSVKESAKPADTPARAAPDQAPPYDGMCTARDLPTYQKVNLPTSGSTADSASADTVAGSTASQPALCNRSAFMPFSCGPRACVGQGMALTEIKAVLSILVAFFKFELAGGILDDLSGSTDPNDDPGSTDGHVYEPFTVGPSLCTRAGVPLLVAPRYATK